MILFNSSGIYIALNIW